MYKELVGGREVCNLQNDAGKECGSCHAPCGNNNKAYLLMSALNRRDAEVVFESRPEAEVLDDQSSRDEASRIHMIAKDEVYRHSLTVRAREDTFAVKQRKSALKESAPCHHVQNVMRYKVQASRHPASS